MPPSVVWKFAVVPSGTGLLNRSVILTVTGTTTPSLFQASTFGHCTASEMLALRRYTGGHGQGVGLVEIVAPPVAVVVAVTRTVVATVPPLTMVCTWPLASVAADAGAMRDAADALY